MGVLESAVLTGLARWKSTEIKVLGGIEFILGLTLLAPALYASIIGEDSSIFFNPGIVSMILGAIQFLLFAPSENFRTVNGVILVALVWLVMFAIGSFPFYFAGLSPVDAIFESVNGFTTTGSTTLEDVSMWPVSLLLWRSTSQWIGGISVVLIFIYLLPMFGMGRLFFTNELEGSGSSQFTMRLKTAGKSFILVYMLLTIINFILLILCNAGIKDAFCLAMTTISTGGLIISNNSLMDFNVYIQIVTMAFMFIGGVNFYLHFKAIYGRNPKVYLENYELRHLLRWFIIASLIIFVIYAVPKYNSANIDLGTILLDYKDSLFTVISIGTTTGASVIDYSGFSSIGIFVLIVLMLVGSSAGSTSGGIKFTRIRVLIRFFNNSMKNVLHPNAVYTIKMDGENVEDSRVLSAVTISLLYLTTTFFGTAVILTQGLPFIDALGLSLGSLTNTGVGFGNFGPMGGYSTLSDSIKIFIMLLMWIGRLEITLALVFLTPQFWSDVRLAYHTSHKRLWLKGRK
ncbi:potassium transport protein TrkH [methanogenic archaeon mixed culture ISO4-G1]|nr:potassium transport protein TrkH [methanogenic archaeon mixed culture ISO4-G1]